MAASTAPGELELVRSFINTIDYDEQTEALARPEQLSAWLRERDLLEADARATASQLARAHELREALRSLCFVNNGEDADAGAIELIEDVAERAGLGVRFSPDSARLEPRRAGIDGALGKLLAIVARAMAEGSWSRLKACRADDCRWAFYDVSRNRSATWCSMSSCGNRAKARAYRTRQRTK